MSDDRSTPGRTLPVDPVVYVETFASHDTLTWTAGPLSRVVDVVRDSESIPSDTTAVVDAVDTAGRHRVAVRDLAADSAVKYVRVEPPAEWTLSWERRTSPTVSVSGAPPPAVCREFHRRTTSCDEWPPAAVDELRALVGSGR